MGVRLLTAAVVIVLLAFGGTGRGLATEISLWTTEFEPDRQATIRHLADLFELYNDGVSVTVKAFNENEIYDRVTAVGEAGPAVITADLAVLTALARAGRLDGSAADRVIGELGPESFHPAPLAQVRVEEGAADRHFAVPLHGWVQLLWFRKDWFEEKGLSPPGDWNDVIAAAEIFHKPEDGRYGIVMGTEPDIYGVQALAHIGLSHGLAWDDWARPLEDNPPAREALGLYRRLAALAPPRPVGWGSRSYFLEGRAAMLIYSSFIVPQLAWLSTVPRSGVDDGFVTLDRIGVVADLGRGDNVTFGALDGVAVMVGLDSAEHEAALRLVRFLYRPEAYITWLNMAPGGMLPVRRGVAEMTEFRRDLGGVYLRYGRNRLLDNVRALDEVMTLPDAKVSDLLAGHLRALDEDGGSR